MIRQRIPIIPFIVLLLGDHSHAGDVKQFDLGHGITVQLEEADFVPADHAIQNCKGSNEPCAIDGILPFGAVDVPRTYLKRLTLIVADQSYDLDTAGMYDAWGDRPLEHKGVIKYLGAQCYDAYNCILRGMFSDAAGAYVSEWVVVNGMPTRTVLSSSDDIVNLFMKNIEPPYYD